jgi:hypothetical protein
MCKNTSTNNECQYLTQETSCIGPSPYKCQCSSGKYFNTYNYKCENLLNINEKCLQFDSCKNSNCFGLPSKCQCLPLQYFDQISGKCQNEPNATSSSTTITSTTSTKTTSILIHSYDNF